LQTSIVSVDDGELRAAMVAHGYCGEHTGIPRGYGHRLFGHEVMHGRVRLGPHLDGLHDIRAPQETAQAMPVIKHTTKIQIIRVEPGDRLDKCTFWLKGGGREWFNEGT
jgi:hypothetical protein